MGLTSNNVRACLFMGDMLRPNTIVGRRNMVSIQKMEYACRRPRNASGFPCGPTLNTTLRLSLRTLPDGELRELYRCICEKDPFPFSVVFSPTFESGELGGERLQYYDSAFVAQGYIVGINEEYNHPVVHANSTAQSSTHAPIVELMTTHVEILLENIVYIGENGNQCRLFVNH